MPIVTIQAKFREVGRIRTGAQEEYTKGGQKRRRPVKLSTFRLTSPRRDLLEQAAAEYGGTVREWADAPDGDQYQLVIESTLLDILVPAGQVVSQWMELWSGGGCQRRCNGERMELPEKGAPCLCAARYADPEERAAAAQRGEACKPTTRLNVFLPRLSDIAVWRLESHGYYAAVELAPMASALAAAANRFGGAVPAQLRIGHRRIKRPNQPPKEFIVPELISAATAGDLFAAQLGAGQPEPRPMLGSGRPAIPAPPALPSDARLQATRQPAGTEDAPAPASDVEEAVWTAEAAPDAKPAPAMTAREFDQLAKAAATNGRLTTAMVQAAHDEHMPGVKGADMTGEMWWALAEALGLVEEEGA